MSSPAAPVPERSGADTRRAFAARVRAPRSAPLPDGVDARRMQVYEELCYSNVEGLLAGAFPVIRSLLGELAQQDRGDPDKAAERSGKISSTARHTCLFCPGSPLGVIWYGSPAGPRNNRLSGSSPR